MSSPHDFTDMVYRSYSDYLYVLCRHSGIFKFTVRKNDYNSLIVARHSGFHIPMMGGLKID